MIRTLAIAILGTVAMCSFLYAGAAMTLADRDRRVTAAMAAGVACLISTSVVHNLRAPVVVSFTVKGTDDE